MAKLDSATTRVSTKGQVILPKAVRVKRNWPAGAELVVEDTPEGVLLKAAPVFPPTRFEDVAGRRWTRRSRSRRGAVLAIDANVAVRYLVDDDHTQFLAARRLVGSAPVFLSSTVMLELEWVLRSATVIARRISRRRFELLRGSRR